MLRENLRYKLLALLIAVIIWAYADVGQNQTVTSEYSAPLEVRNLDPGLVITSMPKAARIVLDGRREDMDNVEAGLYAVTSYIDMRGVDAGRHALPVHVALPKDIERLVRGRSKDTQVVVSTEVKAQRILHISQQLIGAPPTGYQYGAPRLTPDRAVVSGVAAKVAKVRKLIVSIDPTGFDSGNIDGDFAVQAVDVSGGEVAGVEITPERVRLRMDLLVAPTSKVVYVTPTIVGQPNYPYEVRDILIEPQTITVSGSADRLSRFNILRTEPVDVSRRTGTFSARVRAISPPGMQIVGDNKVVVTVDVGASHQSSAHPAQNTPHSSSTKSTDN